MFDPRDPSVVTDPYPHYARLRREAPILRLPDDDIWVVSRYDDIVTLLRDTKTYSSRLGLAADPDASERARTGLHFRIGAPGVRVLIALDRPEHTAFRDAASPAFSAKAICTLQERVIGVARNQVQHLLENSERGDADFVRDVAEPVPTLALAELFGLPVHMHDELRKWALVITADLSTNGNDNDALGRGLNMLRYFRTETRRRRGRTDDGLLSLLANAEKYGLTDREVLSYCGFLVVAGAETTTNLLTNIIDLLVRKPEVQKRLRNNQDLIPAAVEEAIRYDTSVQGLWRSTTRRTELSGQTLPLNARIFVLFGSANRDERHFAQPDEFRLDRQPNDHLGFGHGVHYCLGARLARLEIEAVLRELFKATTWVASGGSSTRIQSLTLRGFSQQRVALTVKRS